MGRELTDTQMDKKPHTIVVNSNGVSHGTVDAISEGSIEAKDYDVKECTEESSVVEKCNEKQDVLGVRSTNFNSGRLEEKTMKPGSQKSSENKKACSPTTKSDPIGNSRNCTVPQPFALATDKRERASCVSRPIGVETAAVGVNGSSNVNNLQSPNGSKKSQVVKYLAILCVFVIYFVLYLWIGVAILCPPLHLTQTRSIDLIRIQPDPFWGCFKVEKTETITNIWSLV